MAVVFCACELIQYCYFLFYSICSEVYIIWSHDCYTLNTYQMASSLKWQMPRWKLEFLAGSAFCRRTGQRTLPTLSRPNSSIPFRTVVRFWRAIVLATVPLVPIFQKGLFLTVPFVFRNSNTYIWQGLILQRSYFQYSFNTTFHN